MAERKEVDAYVTEEQVIVFWNEKFLKVSSLIGGDVRTLGLALGFSISELEAIELDHGKHGTKQVACKTLDMWRQRLGSQAAVAKLAEILEKIRRRDIAEAIYCIPPSTAPADDSGPAGSNQLSEVLENQRKLGELTDVVLVCDGKSFTCHKNVLYGASPYFKKLLSPGRINKNDGRVELSNVTVDEIEIILPFLYTGEIPDVNEPTLIKKLLKTSNRMRIDGLFDYCYKKIYEGLSCENCFEIYKLACEYNISEMTELVVNFLAKHITRISTSEEFRQLTIAELQKIIRKVVINDSIIEVILEWAEAKVGREAALLDIFSSAGLQNLTTDYLMKLIRERTLVKKNLHILTILMAEATARTHFGDVKEYKLCCFGKNNKRQVCRMFDIEQNLWLEPKILPFKLEGGMAILWFEKHVYLVGGGDVGEARASTQVIKYNPTTNVVVSKTNLSVPVYQAGLGVLLNLFYVVNGLNELKQAVRIVQCYNPVANTCKEVTSTNFPHNKPKVFTFCNYLYVLGSEEGFHASVERYDHETDAWTVITNIPGTLKWCSAAISKQTLFVAPSQESDELQVYDFTSATWVQNEAMGLPEKIWGLYSVTLETKCLLLIHDSENVLHFYDDVTKECLRKSASNEEPWHEKLTCVILL